MTLKPADIIRAKELLPTSLGSDAIREQFAAGILRRSFFSAKTLDAGYLARMRDICASFASGAINAADARLALLRQLNQIGIAPGDTGSGLADLAGQRRLDLIIKTQKQMAASAADIAAQTPDTLYQYPAWQLVRFGHRRFPREDWHARWSAAGKACSWRGAYETDMIALKDSPVWQALGDGAGGFRDTLGNPYPPFAYSSGLAWRDVSRADCVSMGLIQPGQQVRRPDASLSPAEQEIRDVAKRLGYSAEDFA